MGGRPAVPGVGVPGIGVPGPLPAESKEAADRGVEGGPYVVGDPTSCSAAEGGFNGLPFASLSLSRLSRSFKAGVIQLILNPPGPGPAPALITALLALSFSF